MEKDWNGNDKDLWPYLVEQNELRQQVIKENCLPGEIRFVAGVDVAYNESAHPMIGAIVVLQKDTLEVVEEAYHEMDITFPYVPGLFSFREIPPLIEAYNHLKIKPDLIVCDGHGIAHPKGVGMATHLGIKLDVPTIGCAKKRLVGVWAQEELEARRGSAVPLYSEEKIVGNVLRTQKDTKPVFVSIGHKVNLEFATSLVLELCPKYRLPETTRKADHLVNSLMKQTTESDNLDAKDNKTAPGTFK
ncbi:deoxyribonuclease V [Maribacter sp. MMG018]|uniref:deoxyribonuclease V n=1 Tax=Maribacter sp. MMG018 TaxID=2822688 RepID=UPI001B374CFD|nr:deoxyribonuclease V [Maribacter sp. MMG018]MBQ4914248.1 deoxyribonuclease V [Maribacter sp. MMG018]